MKRYSIQAKADGGYLREDPEGHLVEYTEVADSFLLKTLCDIREALGVGGKVMLAELPELVRTLRQNEPAPNLGRIAIDFVRMRESDALGMANIDIQSPKRTTYTDMGTGYGFQGGDPRTLDFCRRLVPMIREFFEGEVQPILADHDRVAEVRKGHHRCSACGEVAGTHAANCHQP